LASPQGGVAASLRKFRAATEAADAAGVVFLLDSSENHPGLATADATRHFLDCSATPPCGDARRGIMLDLNSCTASLAAATVFVVSIILSRRLCIISGTNERSTMISLT